jgi:hypothetical protein
MYLNNEREGVAKAVKWLGRVMTWVGRESGVVGEVSCLSGSPRGYALARFLRRAVFSVIQNCRYGV